MIRSHLLALLSAISGAGVDAKAKPKSTTKRPPRQDDLNQRQRRRDMRRTTHAMRKRYKQ